MGQNNESLYLVWITNQRNCIQIYWKLSYFLAETKFLLNIIRLTGTPSVQFPWPALAALTQPCSQTYSRLNLVFCPKSPNPVQGYEKESHPSTSFSGSALPFLTGHPVGAPPRCHWHHHLIFSEHLHFNTLPLCSHICDESTTPRCTAVDSTALPRSTTTQNFPQSPSLYQTSHITCRLCEHTFKSRCFMTFILSSLLT